jgi:hypothetical protein
VTMGLLRRKPSTTGGVVFCLLVAVIPVLIVAFDLPKLSWPQVPATASDCTAHYRRKGNTQRVTDCRMTWSADGTTRSTVVEYPRNDVSDGMTVPTLVRGDDAVDPGDLEVEIFFASLIALGLLGTGAGLTVVAVRSRARSRRPPAPEPRSSRRRDPSRVPPPVVRPYDS